MKSAKELEAFVVEAERAATSDTRVRLAILAHISLLEAVETRSAEAAKELLPLNKRLLAIFEKERPEIFNAATLVRNQRREDEGLV